MQRLFDSSAPLPANGRAVSPWLSVSAAGDWPYLILSILADQAGSVQIQETDLPTTDVEIGVALATGVPANQQFQTGGITTRRYFRVVYTNGPVAQTSFTLSAVTYPPDLGLAPLSQARLLELLLRETRTTNLLLAKLFEPAGSTINLPIGSNQLTK